MAHRRDRDPDSKKCIARHGCRAWAIALACAAVAAALSGCDLSFFKGMGRLAATGGETVTVGAAWDRSAVSAPSLVASLLPLSGPAENLSPVSSESGHALASLGGLEPGRYALIAVLADSSIAKAGACEIVDVEEGGSVRRDYDFSSAGTAAGAWRIGLSSAGGGGGAIELVGWSDSISTTEAIRLSAAVPASRANAVFIWRIDGETRWIGASCSVNLPGARLAAGSHRVEVESLPLDGSAGSAIAKDLEVSAPPPGSDLPGWRLDSTTTGLARLGIDKQGLPRYSGPAKPPAGTTISEMRIDSTLDLSAGNIVVERCWIRPLSIARGNQIIVTYDNDRAQAPAPAPVVVRDCDIDGSALSAYDVCYSTGFAGNGTVQRCDIHGMGSGIAILHAGSAIPALVEGNYVHGLRSWGDPKADGSHTDGFTVRDFAGPSCTLRNNRVDCSGGNDTGAVFIQPYYGIVDNFLAEGNLLEGNGYQMILQRHNYDYGRNMRAADNRFSGTGYGPGYVARNGLSYGWAGWTGNYLDDPGAVDHEGAAVSL